MHKYIKPFVYIYLLIYGINANAQSSRFTDSVEVKQCGSATISFAIECAQKEPGIMRIHVHENETTAVEAMHTQMQQTDKGCFVSWRCQSNRYIRFALGTDSFKFDPNRIYTDQGRMATLTANGSFTPESDSIVKDIATFFLEKFIDSQKLVIAVHNNTDGGGLTINSFAKGGDYAKDTKKIHINKCLDEDDFYLTTNTKIYEFLRKKNFNILLQNNENVTDDGSLSVYAAQHKIAYLNVEAQHGHLEQQIEMLQAIQQYIDTKFRP